MTSGNIIPVRSVIFTGLLAFLEVYLIGFDGDLYGRQLFVEFVDLIRPDKRFASIDELVSQMTLDCGAAVKRLAEPDEPVSALGRLQAEGNV